MNAKKITSKKNKAQAMVEFAIVLPILLLLLYGILEAGRLLFIYSTVVTASRQAVRYGSATGEGSSTVPRYQDCAGIRDAAQRVDYLNAFDPGDIRIYHDDGPDPSTPSGGKNTQEYCILPLTTDSWAPTNNTSRIVVEIKGNYFPIVPKIVGFLERSDSSASGPIEAQSARTVMVSVTIFVTAPPSNWKPDTSTPSNTPTPTDTPTPTNTATATATKKNKDTPTPTATATSSATASASATITMSPTITRTPTIVPSPVPSCNLQAGAITLPGNNTMTLTITNPNAWPIMFGDVFVKWDHDRGHGGGNDKTLRLQTVKLGSNEFFNGNEDGPSLSIKPAEPVVIPPNTTLTLTFTFHQTYDASDGSEEINIGFSTPGCENSFIHVTR